MYNRLKGIDYFATIVGLRYNGSWRYQTVFGGLVTFLMIFFAIGILIFFLIQFISRNDINMTFQTIKNFDPPILNLSNNFSIAISMQYGAENKINSNIVEISYEYVTFDYILNKQTVIPLPSTNCTIDKFKQAASQFKELGIANGVCVDTTNLTIQGSNVNNYFSFLRAKFSLCNDRPDCLSLSNISDLITNERPVANLYYVDSTFKPNDPSNFVVYYINNVNVNVTFGDAKETNVFFSQNTLSVQNGWIFPTSPQTYTVITIDNYRDLVSVRTEDQMNNMNFNIMSSRNNQQINISYMQFSQFLANIGGIINNVMIIFSIFVYYFNNVSFQVKVSKDLLRFKSSHNTEVKQKIKKIYFEALKVRDEANKGPKILSLSKNQQEFESKIEFLGLNKPGLGLSHANKGSESNINMKEDRSDNVELTEVKKNASTLDHIRKETEKRSEFNNKNKVKLNLTDLEYMKKDENSHFDPSDMYYLYLCGCLKHCSKNFKKKKAFLNKIESFLNNTQDFSNLFKKVIELDLMKYVLFNNDQINVMNYLTKPELVLFNEKMEIEDNDNAADSFSRYYTSVNNLDNSEYRLKERNEIGKFLESLNSIFKSEANSINVKLIKSFRNIFESA